MRKSYPLILLLCFVLSVQHVSAQQIEANMNAYAERFSTEKIHIHFDKTVYNRGETVWYKVYLLHRGDSASQNIYLNWYDAKGKLIKHHAVPVLLSSSQGAFDIPDDYQFDELYVKAYTSWMLNDDPAFSYVRGVTVNTNQKKGGGISNVLMKTNVAVYPEGGVLVQNLHTRIAFKASNQYGWPVKISGTVVDNEGALYDSLRVEHDGMGSFYLIPKAGKQYRLNWTDQNGVEGTVAIPTAVQQGARISIQQVGTKARFQVARTDDADASFRQMHLLVHMNQVPLYQVAINASEKNSIGGEIPLQELPSGVLQFTLFSSDWIPVAERVIYVNNGTYRFEVGVSGSLTDFDKKARNEVEIEVPDTLFTNMSVSITDADLSTSTQHSIFSDLLLSSDIRGKINNPAYYFNEPTNTTAGHLDLVMLTHGWRKFDWQKIKSGILPVLKYPLESKSMYLSGQIKGLKKRLADPVMNMLVLGNDSSRQIIYAPIDKNGYFEHPLVFFDSATIRYSISNKPDVTANANIRFMNGLLPAVNTPIPPLMGSIQTGDYNEGKLSEILAEQERLRKLLAEATLKEVVVTTRVKTKLELLNDKYATGFFKAGPTRKEYIFDLTDNTKIPSTSYTVFDFIQNLGLPSFSIAREGGIAWRNERPDFFLNELAVDPDNWKTILDMSLMDIAMIKAFPPIFMFGAGKGRGGAFAIYTKMGDDYPPAPEVKNMLSAQLAGYTKFREFESVDYTAADEASLSRTDKRVTLYWNPLVITNKTQQKVKVHFFNNDFTKVFRVVVEGVNEEGKLTRVEKLIKAN